MDNSMPTRGPDPRVGISEVDLPDDAMLVGHVDEEAVLLARRGNEVFAIGATCTHYGGPLGEGLMVEDTVRCPWHHACFSLRTGEALAAHALTATSCWHVERRAGRLFVREKVSEIKRRMQANPRASTGASDAGARLITRAFPPATATGGFASQAAPRLTRLPCAARTNADPE